MDPLVLVLAVLSAACFLAFALWSKSSPRGQIEVVRGSEDDPPAVVLGKAAAGLALDWGPLALALRDLRADGVRGGRREADELKVGASGEEAVTQGPAGTGVKPTAVVSTGPLWKTGAPGP